MNKVIYAGSFDPITNGHIDIIKRASKLFDVVDVVIMNNAKKKSLFDVEERKAMIEQALEDIKDSVVVNSHDGLLVDYCAKVEVYTLVRGLRALTDFDYEFQMAITNKKLNAEVEAVLLVSDVNFSYISSSLVKEIAGYHGDVSSMVPENVERKLQEKFYD